MKLVEGLGSLSTHEFTLWAQAIRRKHEAPTDCLQLVIRNTNGESQLANHQFRKLSHR
jgi:hypothetical protein